MKLTLGSPREVSEVRTLSSKQPKVIDKSKPCVA